MRIGFIIPLKNWEMQISDASVAIKHVRLGANGGKQ
jgi:hypothetical protein